MFDPKQWQSYQFQDVEVVPFGQHRQIKMTVLFDQVVVLTSVNVINGDTADQDYELQWQPGSLTLAGTFIARTVSVGAGRTLVPEMPDGAADAKFQGPFLFQGPGAFIIDSPTNIANAGGSTMQYNIHWLQAKFAGKASDQAVTIGVDI